MIVACLALTIALSGASYAAVVLPRNSVGATQLKMNAVTAKKVKNGNVTGGKIAANAVTGVKVKDSTLGSADIADGTLGSADIADGGVGEGDLASGAGGPDAYVRVEADGDLTPSTAGGPVMTKGITLAMIQHVDNTGQYCFDLDFVPRSAMVSIDNRDAAATSNQIISVSTTRGTPLTQCPAPFQDVRVNILQVDQTNAPALTDQDFYIWFEK
jgi:hypothetical protein